MNAYPESKQQQKGGSSVAVVVILFIFMAIMGVIIYQGDFHFPAQKKIYSSDPVLNEQLTNLWNNITADKTDEREYIEGTYKCVDFARDLDSYLDSQGFESYEVWAYPEKGTTYDFFGDGKLFEEAHAVVGVFVYDGNHTRYLILIEPQTDEKVFDRYDANNDGFISSVMEGGKYSMERDGLHGWDGKKTTDGNLFIIFGET